MAHGQIFSWLKNVQKGALGCQILMKYNTYTQTQWRLILTNDACMQ